MDRTFKSDIIAGKMRIGKKELCAEGSTAFLPTLENGSR